MRCAVEAATLIRTQFAGLFRSFPVDDHMSGVVYVHRLEMVMEFGATSVLICAAGDIHGAMDRLYVDVLAFEAALGSRFDWVLHVGDFGIWPDPEKIDRGSRNHDGAGDFSKWLTAGRSVLHSR